MPALAVRHVALGAARLLPPVERYVRAVVPGAARLASRFGLVNTGVFGHIPSSVCLIVAASS
jgi:hypothetical protein